MTEKRTRRHQTLIVNKTNFDQPWAAEILSTVFTKDMKVLVMPLGDNEGWASDAGEWNHRFEEDSDYHYDLERPFRSYGIHHFAWFDYYQEDEASAAKRIQDSDVLVLVGTDPAACMDRIRDLGLEDALLRYPGMIITLSEAGHILEGEFECGELYVRHQREGIGLLSGAHLHMHYQETEEELRQLIRKLESDGLPILVLSEKSGVYFEEGGIELLGDAFIAEASDLDEMYGLL